MKPLTARDIETLEGLASAHYNRLGIGADLWMMPMDCGGFNGSHHSYTLHKLAARGLCELKKYGNRREKGSCRYRFNAAGYDFLARETAYFERRAKVFGPLRHIRPEESPR